MKELRLFLFLCLAGIFFAGFVLAADSGSASGLAWSAIAGWVNFGCANCNVVVSDSAITGYAWNENYGWINLSPSTGGVKNDGNGNLSGYAWCSKTGWINFSEVKITNGVFSGTALGDNNFDINFNCDNCNVQTDWQPATSEGSSSGGGEYLRYPEETTNEQATKTATESKTEPTANQSSSVAQTVINTILEQAQNLSNLISGLIPKKSEETENVATVSESAPLALSGNTEVLPVEKMDQFILSDLPSDIKLLVEKFPQLEQTLTETGVTKMSDIGKLKSVTFTLPTLTEVVDLSSTDLGVGKISLVKGVPITQLTSAAKAKIPSGIIFAKTAGGLVDYNIALSLNDQGKAQQKISVISKQSLQLIVKTEKSAKKITGYLILKSKTYKETSYNFSLNDLAASLTFANPDFEQDQTDSTESLEKLVLQKFEFEDTGDNVYTADITAPSSDGEYEVLAIVNYEDASIESKEVKLITVVDPEGYVYEVAGNKQTRIPNATVSLYWLNPETAQYELWPAKEYQQKNPQTTDETGSYSFLAPPGYYYLTVSAKNYKDYKGEVFQLTEGGGVHDNIKLTSVYWWLTIIDWKIWLLIFIITLLVAILLKQKIKQKIKQNNL